LYFIIFLKAGNPHGLKKTLFTPEPEIAVNGTCGSELLGQGLPLDTGTQDIEDCFKDPAGFHGVTASTGFPLVCFCGIPLFVGHEGLHELPKLIGYFPGMFLFHTYPPGLYFGGFSPVI
jgi:hypothetical protein